VSQNVDTPIVSVCMAAYNGGRYISEQIVSILAQLRSSDELIVVDDASTDDSFTIVESLRDARIRLFRNAANLGVIRTFERALGYARGDLIFLSDQDDVWIPEKVNRIRSIFEEDRSVTLIQTNGLKMDANGNLINDRIFKPPVRLDIFQTFLRNLYQGSAMALRKEVVDLALPFPRAIPMHDSWLGLVNCIVGKSYFLDEDFIYYRRHSATVTRGKRSSLPKNVRDRWGLLTGLLQRFPRLVFRHGR
jgi:glycosyltransferase involved in cell wall biosynthesis